MGKFHIGELVRFREAEISLSAIPSLSVKLKTDNLSGKVTGLIDCGPEETKYYVDVKMPVKDMVVNVTLKESELLTPSEYVHKVIDDMMKKTEEFKKRILPSDKPDSYGWLKSFTEPVAIYGRIPKDLKPLRITTEFSELLKKWEGERNAASVVDKKMSKMRCIKLLESYRAERENVKSGRRFERCLRDNVVDEALERAIELLKSDLK